MRGAQYVCVHGCVKDKVNEFELYWEYDLDVCTCSCVRVCVGKCLYLYSDGLERHLSK